MKTKILFVIIVIMVLVTIISTYFYLYELTTGSLIELPMWLFYVMRTVMHITYAGLSVLGFMWLWNRKFGNHEEQ